MRILSPSSDAQTILPYNETTATTDSDKGAETKSAKTPILTSSSTVSTVVLDTDVVSNNMAARLCISFLSHILFLKNQVPFPIIQLARVPTNNDTTRAAKKRCELLNSFDTLASHLYTTFIALSTALALRGTPEKTGLGADALGQRQKHGAARVFLAVALGPTVGSAKSRVIVGIDGLETKVWGMQEDNVPDTTTPTDVSEEEDDQGSVEDLSDTDEEDEQSEEEEGGDSDEEEADVSGSDGGALPPSSRSPSPAPLSGSRASPPTSPRNMPLRVPLHRAEDPDTVRAAERLLSRTLASACAEDDGHGLASEMAPTQIHILLRAPRRFDHPSWIPRQNLSTSMDGCVADFLAESGETSVFSEATAKKRTKASKVQGVWLKSRAGSMQTFTSPEDEDEEDELIWWSWDGKLVGFADW